MTRITPQLEVFTGGGAFRTETHARHSITLICDSCSTLTTVSVVIFPWNGSDPFGSRIDVDALEATCIAVDPTCRVWPFRIGNAEGWMSQSISRDGWFKTSASLFYHGDVLFLHVNAPTPDTASQNAAHALETIVRPIILGP